MGFSDILAIGLLFLALIGGGYLFFNYFNQKDMQFQAYESNLTDNLSSSYGQFYPNLRFPTNTITYTLSDSCDSERINAINSAFTRIESISKIDFVESNRGVLKILCSDVSPTPEKDGRYVAGEGGPTKILNATRFYVIQEAQISLYRQEKCDPPVVSLHELLHALGFDHINKRSSVLYPISECGQQLDQEVIDTLNDLYSVPSLPDLALVSLTANQTGRYLNFQANIDNYGLADSEDSKLEIYTDQKLIQTFDLEGLEYGKRKVFTASNVAMPGNVGQIEFKVINSGSKELDLSNNVAVINVLEAG